MKKSFTTEIHLRKIFSDLLATWHFVVKASPCQIITHNTYTMQNISALQIEGNLRVFLKSTQNKLHMNTDLSPNQDIPQLQPFPLIWNCLNIILHTGMTKAVCVIICNCNTS